MIDDFDHLVDLRTLARHYLGLEPSAYVLCAIEIEKNSKCSFGFIAVLNSLHFFFLKCFSFAEMTTKFNQEMHAKMRAKKNEPLSNLRKRVVRVVEKRTPVTLATSIPEATRIVSPTTSMKEITHRTKKSRLADKGKGKADSRSSSIWTMLTLP